MAFIRQGDYVTGLGKLRAFIRNGNAFQHDLRFFDETSEDAFMMRQAHMSRPIMGGFVPLGFVPGGYDDEDFNEQEVLMVADRRVVAVCAKVFIDCLSCLKEGKDPQGDEPVFLNEWVELPVPTEEEADRICASLHIPNPLNGETNDKSDDWDAQIAEIEKATGVKYVEDSGFGWDGGWLSTIRAAQKAAWVAHGPLLEMIGGKYDRIRLDEYRKLPKEDQAMIADPAECPLNAQSLGGDVFVYDDKTGGRWWFLDSKGRPCSHHMGDMWGKDVEFDDSPAGEETAYNDYVFKWPGHCSLGVAPKGYVYVPIPQLPGSEKGCSMAERNAELIAYSDLALKHKAEAEAKAKADGDKDGEADGDAYKGGSAETKDAASPKGVFVKNGEFGQGELDFSGNG